MPPEGDHSRRHRKLSGAWYSGIQVKHGSTSVFSAATPLRNTVAVATADATAPRGTNLKLKMSQVIDQGCD